MLLVVTLSFGYKKPEDGDRGDPVFQALEDNIDRVNSHTHDGSDSPRIDTYKLTKTVQAVTAVTDWAASGDLYRKLITFPAGFTAANSAEFGKTAIRYFYSGGTYDGQELFPKTERVTDTTFYLYNYTDQQAFNVLFN